MQKCCQQVQKKKFPFVSEIHIFEKKWIQILRMGKNPSKYMSVCSDHFQSTDYMITNYGEQSCWLKIGAIPSQHLPKTSLEMNGTIKPKIAKQRSQRLVKQSLIEVSHTVEVSTSHETTENIDECEIADIGEIDDPNETVTEPMRTQSKKYDKSAMASPNVRSKHTQTMFGNKRIDYASINDKDLHYATGLDRERFELIFSYLEKFCPIADTQHWSRKDALLITLFKLRHNLDYKMIEFNFQIARASIASIFKEVLEKLYIALKRIDLWKLSYKDAKAYRTIIDCTEFFVVSADGPLINQLTYSIYKSRPTFKLLVGCDEKGGVNFISDVFVGSSTDREMFTKSGLFDKLEEDDAVLADRGFDISDLLEEKGILLNIPPFLRGKSQLTEYETMKTRIIANRRILIENVNCRAKKNLILVDPMPTCLWPLANMIIYVCFALVNFYNPLK